jgi:hypothetical protein
MEKYLFLAGYWLGVISLCLALIFRVLDCIRRDAAVYRRVWRTCYFLRELLTWHGGVFPAGDCALVPDCEELESGTAG